MVRNPADLLRYSLSAPINPPIIITINSLISNISTEGMVKNFKTKLMAKCASMV